MASPILGSYSTPLNKTNEKLCPHEDYILFIMLQMMNNYIYKHMYYYTGFIYNGRYTIFIGQFKGIFNVNFK